MISVETVAVVTNFELFKKLFISSAIRLNPAKRLVRDVSRILRSRADVTQYFEYSTLMDSEMQKTKSYTLTVKSVFHLERAVN